MSFCSFFMCGLLGDLSRWFSFSASTSLGSCISEWPTWCDVKSVRTFWLFNVGCTYLFWLQWFHPATIQFACIVLCTQYPLVSRSTMVLNCSSSECVRLDGVNTVNGS